jgi:hypothetical protein
MAKKNTMKQMKKIGILIFLVTVLSTGNSFSQNVLQTATAEGGKVKGAIEDGIGVFKGIPFAVPPVGELRWRAPQPVISWKGVLKADEFAPACPQMTFSWSGAPKETSEDCLKLNIWTLAKSVDEKLPVMVCIYGGGFALGNAPDPGTYGNVLAPQVTIKKRIRHWPIFSVNPLLPDQLMPGPTFCQKPANQMCSCIISTVSNLKIHLYQ